MCSKSGVLLFLSVPFLIWALSLSLSSPDSFNAVLLVLKMPLIKIVLWLFLTALIYHLFAGVRHFVMDLGYAESLRGGRIGAYSVIIISILFAILLGICLW